VFGYFTTSISDILGSDTALSQVIAGGATTQADLVAAFLVTILSMVGIIASVPGVQTMLRVRTEEMDDRLEPIIATAVPRSRYYASNVIAALGASTVFVLIAGTLISLLASTADIGISFGEGLLQTAATVPAVWTVVALSVTVIGVRPKAAIAAWVGVLASFVLTLLGPTFRLPDWALGISPFWHVPHIAAADPDLTGLAWITAVTILFLAVGFAGFRRRDLAV
jgi:ABC-2 type transport system permease protein